MKTKDSERIVGRDVSVGEVMDIIMRDEAYYRRTGGGITLSGGEALCQTEFAHALLDESKKMGISTAVETTACLPFSMIEPHLSLIDHVLLDIKHVDPIKHERYTGIRCELIMQNARRIAASGVSLTVRVPTIPTFNDTEEEIGAIADFAKSLPAIRELHLLPYHRLGYDKYIGLGRDYPMGEINPPDGKKMETLKEVAEKRGLKVIIGG